MGYYTDYLLKTEWMPEKVDLQSFDTMIYEMLVTALLENKDAVYAFGEKMAYADGEGQNTRWYDHEKDFIALSKQFPDVLFTLDGEGEEAGDIWRKFFYRGEMAGGKAQIILPESPW